MGREEHRRQAPKRIRVAILSVSSTRGLAEDESGQWIRRQAETEGHAVVAHKVVPDDVPAILAALDQAMGDEPSPHVVLVTGGTGITPKDVTIEALRPRFEKELTAFGALFAQLSFEQIDAAAVLSRATAGIVDGCLVFCMPGSLKACKLACNALIFPELGHFVKHLMEPG